MLTYGATVHFIVPELDAGNQIVHQSTFTVPPGTGLDEIMRLGQTDHEPCVPCGRPAARRRRGSRAALPPRGAGLIWSFPAWPAIDAVPRPTDNDNHCARNSGRAYNSK